MDWMCSMNLMNWNSNGLDILTFLYMKNIWHYRLTNWVLPGQSYECVWGPVLCVRLGLPWLCGVARSSSPIQSHPMSDYEWPRSWMIMVILMIVTKFGLSYYFDIPRMVRVMIVNVVMNGLCMAVAAMNGFMAGHAWLCVKGVPSRTLGCFYKRTV